MRLHSAPRSGNSYKVRLLLGLLGTTCEIVNYDTKGGETHQPGFLNNVNPDGKVPVLELEDGTMLPESGAILYYLAEDTPYLPEQTLERAQVLRWMFFEQYSLLPNLSRPRLWHMWEVEITPQREAELEQFFEQGYRALSVMERHLSDREFFVGDRPTVADLARYDDRSLSCGKEIAVLDVAIMIEWQDGINWTRWRMAQTFRDETLI